MGTAGWKKLDREQHDHSCRHGVKQERGGRHRSGPIPPAAHVLHHRGEQQRRNDQCRSDASIQPHHPRTAEPDTSHNDHHRNGAGTEPQATHNTDPDPNPNDPRGGAVGTAPVADLTGAPVRAVVNMDSPPGRAVITS